MLQFEKARFAGWAAGVDAAVATGLQQPLLARQAPATGDASGAAAAGAGGEGSAAAGSGGAAGPGGAASNGGSGSGSGGSLASNFPPGLLLLAREAKYLAQLGFPVPRAAVNLALQEGQLRCGAAGRGGGRGTAAALERSPTTWLPSPAAMLLVNCAAPIFRT